MWRSFLERLDSHAGDEASEAAAIHGALRTFGDFEVWMNGWREGAGAKEAAKADDGAAL
jgi:heme oxygenase